MLVTLAPLVSFPGAMSNADVASGDDAHDVLFGVYIDGPCAIAFVSWKMLQWGPHSTFVSGHDFVSEGHRLAQRAYRGYSLEG